MLTTTQLATEGRAISSDGERGTGSFPSETRAQPPIHQESVNSDGNEPSHQDIAVLAYSYWLSRIEGEGSATDDWLRAEQELRTKPLETAK
jgi:hypothetical protein